MYMFIILYQLSELTLICMTIYPEIMGMEWQ